MKINQMCVIAGCVAFMNTVFASEVSAEKKNLRRRLQKDFPPCKHESYFVTGKAIYAENGTVAANINVKCYDYEHGVAPVFGKGANEKLHLKKVTTDSNGDFEVEYCSKKTDHFLAGWDFWTPFNKKVANPDIFCALSRSGDSIMDFTSKIYGNYDEKSLDLGHIKLYPKRYSKGFGPTDKDGFCKMDGPSGKVLQGEFKNDNFYQMKFSPACQNFDCCYASSMGNLTKVDQCLEEFEAVTTSICNKQKSLFPYSFRSCKGDRDLFHAELKEKYSYFVSNEASKNLYDESTYFRHCSHCKNNAGEEGVCRITASPSAIPSATTNVSIVVYFYLRFANIY